MALSRWISTLALLATATPGVSIGQGSQAVTREEATKAIQDGIVAWSKARVALDRGTFEKMLGPAPDFYIQLPDRKLTRQEFIELSSAYPSGVTLTRFDATVLTVEPSGNDWVAIISQKIEKEHSGIDGKVEKEYVLLISRDGWRKVSSDKWVVTFSEQVGRETWRGAPPPVKNW